jgi:tetratricopeptide (TPR) repeat protein
MKTSLAALALILGSSVAFAQDGAQVRKLFEAGKYDQVIDAGQSSPHAAPDIIYAAAQSAQKTGNVDQAREFYDRLATFPEDNAWHFVGVSGARLLGEETDAARDAAQQAVDRGGDVAEAHYQLGLVLAKVQDWTPAAAQFDRAAELNPSMAYAHYYGGLMHYRANRPDRMANHFEYFLKLAPEAPERPEVMQIMKTVRGR